MNQDDQNNHNFSRSKRDQNDAGNLEEREQEAQLDRRCRTNDADPNESIEVNAVSSDETVTKTTHDRLNQIRLRAETGRSEDRVYARALVDVYQVPGRRCSEADRPSLITSQSEKLIVF